MAAPSPITAEHRRNSRRRTLKDGKIVLPGAFVTFACTLRDLSENGARLRLGTPAQLPRHFELVIVGDSIAYEAELRWRRGLDAGVRFLGEPKKVGARLW